MEGKLTNVINCVTNCYMRSILNVSLPSSLAEMVREEVRDGGYASVSEFVRELLREWYRGRALRDIRISQKEFGQGKGKLLKSLKDLR